MYMHKISLTQDGEAKRVRDPGPPEGNSQHPTPESYPQLAYGHLQCVQSRYIYETRCDYFEPTLVDLRLQLEWLIFDEFVVEVGCNQTGRKVITSHYKWGISKENDECQPTKARETFSSECFICLFSWTLMDSKWTIHTPGNPSLMKTKWCIKNLSEPGDYYDKCSSPQSKLAQL